MINDDDDDDYYNDDDDVLGLEVERRRDRTLGLTLTLQPNTGELGRSSFPSAAHVHNLKVSCLCGANVSRNKVKMSYSCDILFFPGFDTLIMKQLKNYGCY